MAKFTLAGCAIVREVVEQGSFTAAAAALGYTQSAISRQVAAMEQAAGVALFERTRRGVRLTEPGRRFVVHAVGALDHVDAAKRELAALESAGSARLRLGAFPTAIAALVPRALASFAARHPIVEVVLREGTTPTQLRRVRSGAIDLAVIGSTPGEEIDPSGLAVTPLIDDPLLLAVANGHAFAPREVIDVEELANERWVTGSTDPNDALLGVWPSLRWQPRVAFVARDWTAKLGLVAAGLGVALVPGVAASAVRPDVALVRIRGEQRMTRQVAAVASKDATPPLFASALVESLERAGAALAAEAHERVA